MPVIGYLSARTPPDSVELPPRPRRNRLRRGPERGDRIPLAGGYDRLQEMVADLVQRQVAVIVIPNTTGSALAAKAATESMPNGGIERAWFFLLALTRPVWRKVGLNAENLRPLFSRAASLSGKHL